MFTIIFHESEYNKFCEKNTYKGRGFRNLKKFLPQNVRLSNSCFSGKYCQNFKGTKIVFAHFKTVSQYDGIASKHCLFLYLNRFKINITVKTEQGVTTFL